MNNKNNKRGISAVVATILIILITIAAVTILWTAIVPMFGSQLDKSIVCSNAVMQIQLKDDGYTCKSPPSVISVQIGRGAKDFNLADIQVIFSRGGDASSYSLNTTSAIPLPGINEAKVYVIPSSVVGNIATIDKIQIAPVVTIGNTQEVCDVSDTIVLKDC